MTHRYKVFLAVKLVSKPLETCFVSVPYVKTITFKYHSFIHIHDPLRSKCNQKGGWGRSAPQGPQIAIYLAPSLEYKNQ